MNGTQIMNKNIIENRSNVIPFSPLRLKSSRGNDRRGVPPTIVEPLKAKELKLGEDIMIQCLVSADPEVEFQWTKNSIPICKSERIKYGKTEDGHLFLSLAHSKLDDSGVYMVVAKNPSGMARISCQILVISADNRDFNDIYSRKAVFLKSPSDQKITINGTIDLSFELRIFIDTKIIWLLNGEPLKATTRIETRFDGRFARLIVKNFRTEDSGLYTLVAVNSDGQSSSDVFVSTDSSNLTRESAQSYTMPNKRSSGSKSLYLERSLRPVQGKIVRLETSVPIFIRTINNITAKLGRSIKFSAQLRGFPLPELTWLFRGKALPQADKYTYDFDENTGLATLTIKDIVDSDFGFYNLTATNNIGSVSCSARLILAATDEEISPSTIETLPSLSDATIPDQPSYIISGVQTTGFVDWKSFQHLETPTDDQSLHLDDNIDLEKPILHTSIQDCTVHEGDVIILWAKVYSASVPQIIWLKNEGPISQSSRFQMTFDRLEGKIQLKISQATCSDSGIYALVVHNQKGFITCHANATVMSTPNIDFSAFVSPDKFKILDADKIVVHSFSSGVNESSCTPNISELIGLERETKEVMSNLHKLSQPAAKLSFKEELIDMTLSEGESMVLQALLSASPAPKCTWYHNGLEVDIGSRYDIHFNPFNQMALLYLKTATLVDSGQYKLIAHNTAGSISSIANLIVNPIDGIDSSTTRSEKQYENLEKTMNVIEFEAGVDHKTYSKNLNALNEIDIDKKPVIKEIPTQSTIAPRLLSQLEECHCREGDSVLLTIRIDALPMPQIKWTRNSQLLQASNRVIIHYDLSSKTATLCIKHITLRDAGLYEVTANNVSGSVSSKTSINVDLVSSIENSPFVKPEAFSELDRDKTNIIEVQPGVDTSFFIEPSRFEGLDVKLEHMQEVEEDTSRYEAPKFIAPLQKEEVVNEDSIVQLIAVVSGYPVPEFTWKKHNMLLPYSNRIQQDYNLASRLCCLTINFSRDYDSGIYTLHAQNQVGQAECETNLIVKSTVNIDVKPMLPPSTFDLIENKQIGRDLEFIPGVDSSTMFNPELYESLNKDKISHVVKVHQLEMTMPYLIKPLNSCTVNEGGDVCLTCQLFGIPMPEIAWSKNGMSINASSRIVVFYDILNKTAYLWLKKSTLDDIGNYQLVAVNKKGSVNSQCQLIVEPSGKPVDESFFVSPKHFEPLEKEKEDLYSLIIPGVDKTGFVDETRFNDLEIPVKHIISDPEQIIRTLTIRKQLCDLQIKENQPIVIELIVDGSPIDKIIWKQNGRIVLDSNIIIPEYDVFNHAVRLRILSANSKLHGGQYEVTLINSLGSVTSTCFVQIESTSDIDRNTNRELKHFEGLEVQMLQRDFGESGVDNRPYTHNLEQIMMLDITRQKEIFEKEIEQKAPLFSGPILISQDIIRELDNVTLTAHVKGLPCPTFYWMKDGNSLLYSNRFAMHYNILNKTLSFYIQNVRLSDNGTYYAVAENQAGSAISSNITLDIKVIESIDKSGKMPISRFNELEANKLIKKSIIPGVDTGSYTSGDLQHLISLDQKELRRLDVVPGVDQSGFVDISTFSELEKPKMIIRPTSKNIKPDCKPEFLSHLTCTEVIEGQNALISVMLLGWPLPEVKWLKDGQYLPMSNRISSIYDVYTKVLNLYIKQARLEDLGDYRLVISNYLGSIEDCTQIKVIKDVRIDVKSFVQNSDVIIAELEQDKRAIRQYDSGIDHISYVDIQKLKELENSRIRTPATYTAGIDNTSMVNENNFAGLEKTLRRKDYEDDRSSYRAPMIIQPMQDISIVEGQEWYLTCVIDGFPVPTFELKKNGQQIESSNRHISYYDMNTKLLYLRVNSGNLHDSGVYTVIACNECGSSENSAQVLVSKTSTVDLSTVQPKSIDKIKILDLPRIKRIDEPVEVPYQAPTFTEISQSISVPEGSCISIPIQLNLVYPMPMFRWTKDDKQLQAANRFLHHYDMHSRILLFKILNANYNDEGKFAVEAYNAAGKAQFILNLQVEKLPSIDRTWQALKATTAVTQLEDKLSQLLPVTIVASGVDLSSYVAQIDKFNILDIEKPKPELLIVDRKVNLAPCLIKQLENISVDETNEVVIQAQLNNAFPVCTVQWFRNKMELRLSNRVQPLYNMHTGLVSLRLLNCQMRDGGQYTLNVKNNLGQDTSSCLLSVNSVSSIDRSFILPPDRLSILEQEKIRPDILLKSETSTSPIIAEESLQALKDVESQMEQRSRPSITSKEDDSIALQILKQPEIEIRAKDGDTVRIQCIVTGRPIPKFVWYKNGSPLCEANRYSCHYDFHSKNISLLINHVIAEVDAGSYVLYCFGSNNQKICSQSCNIIITSSSGVVKDKLIVSDAGIKHLDDINKQIAERKILSYHKLQPGVDSRSFVDFEKFTKLEQQELALIPIMPGVDSSSFVPVERFVSLEQPLPVKYFSSGIDHTSNVAESSLNHLQSFDQYHFTEIYEPLIKNPRMQLISKISKDGTINALEASPISMSCTVDAYPMPVFKWYHNDKLISSSQRVIPSYDPFTGIVSIHFMTLYVKDAGKYSVNVSNSVGELNEQVNLSVDPTAKVDESSYIRSSLSYTINSDTLEFVGKESKSIDFIDFPSEQLYGSVGATIIIRYKPAGGANVQTRWILNDVEITERLQIQTDQDGICWFALKDLSKEQCGVYSCIIKNSFGEFIRKCCIQLGQDSVGVIQSSVPLITEELKSIIVREGDNAELSLKYSGPKDTTILWLLNDLPIKEDDHKSLSIDQESVTSIAIRKTRKSDGGWYQCILKNSAGTAISKAKLLVAASELNNSSTAFSPMMLRSVQQNSNEDARLKWIKPAQPKEIVDTNKIFLGQLKRSRVIKGTASDQKQVTLTAADMYRENDSKPAQLKIRLPEKMEFVQDHDYILQTTVVPIDDPFMKVQWFKDEHLIESGDRLSVIYEMGYASLTVKKAYSSDAGKYDCVVSNKFGSDKTTCYLTCQYTRPVQSESNISQLALEKLQGLETNQSLSRQAPFEVASDSKQNKPQVTMPLSNVSVKERQQVKLIAKFSSNPKARISWMLNGKVILNAGRFSIRDDGMLNSLVINPCRGIDNGEIRCVAKNKLGEASTSCQLSIDSAERPVYWDLIMDSAMEIHLAADEIAKMDNEFREKLKSSTFDNAKAEAVNYVKELVKDLKIKYKELAKNRVKLPQSNENQLSPQLLLDLPPSSTVEEGQCLTLCVRYSPSNSTVSWMRNHGQLQNSKDFKIRTGSDGRSCLIIPFALSSDTGLYEVKVSNNLGSTTSNNNVVVEQSQTGQLSSDFVVVPLIKSVKPGSSAKFTCRSRQKVNWIRIDGKPIPNNRSISKSLNEYTHQFILTKIIPTDAGQYGCRISGKLESISFQLNVVDTANVSESGEIIVPLKDTMEVKEGEPVTLNCQIQESHTNEECVWMKDDTLITGQFTESESIGELRILRLFDASLNDEGVYSAMLKSSGKKTQCKLSVKKRTEENVIPILLSAIKSISVMEGQSAKFEFVLNNTQIKPEISWIKDNRPLPESQDYDVWFKDGHGVLFIKNTLPEDSGVYSCVIKQSNRMVNCDGLLSVRRSL